MFILEVAVFKGSLTFQGTSSAQQSFSGVWHLVDVPSVVCPGGPGAWRTLNNFQTNRNIRQSHKGHIEELEHIRTIRIQEMQKSEVGHVIKILSTCMKVLLHSLSREINRLCNHHDLKASKCRVRATHSDGFPHCEKPRRAKLSGQGR